jgi:transcriptional regulator with XRE-family HTH domain
MSLMSGGGLSKGTYTPFGGTSSERQQVLWDYGDNALIKGFSEQMSFGTRLAEERKRLGLRQAEFAALVGTNVPKQSLYENDKRELRADYLARLAEAGVDVVYVLMGRRSEGESLGQASSDLLTAYLMLPANLQRALDELARALRERFSRPPSR